MRSVILFLDGEKPFAFYSRFLPLISDERQSRIARMAVDGDKVRSFFAELLIRYNVSEQLGVDFGAIKIEKGEFGKPFIVGAKGYDFSVSHSAQAVAFTGGFSAVGVDIELIKQRKSSVTERFFTANEVRFIEQCGNTDKAFFEVWTKKEAYSKMLGKGLAAGFRSFDVMSGELDCTFYTATSHGYAFSVCSRDAVFLQKPVEFTEEMFLKKLSEKVNFTLY